MKEKSLVFTGRNNSGTLKWRCTYRNIGVISTATGETIRKDVYLSLPKKDV